MWVAYIQINHQLREEGGQNVFLVMSRLYAVPEGYGDYAVGVNERLDDGVQSDAFVFGVPDGFDIKGRKNTCLI